MYSIIYLIWTLGYLLIFYTLSYNAVLCYLSLLLHLFQFWPFGICVLWIYCHHCFVFCVLSYFWHFRILWTHFTVSPKRNWKIVLEIRYGHRVYNQFCCYILFVWGQLFSVGLVGEMALDSVPKWRSMRHLHIEFLCLYFLYVFFMILNYNQWIFLRIFISIFHLEKS